ncbi:hypothetical protein HMPREF0391_10404 [Finegoldia magna ATCC 53516]|uniref:Uncharacterized protein n=1 Tax=Finegoldia magna ATCC 53516 TaxID=525282 RepID=D6S7I2_FINMA|nr:hypothetical protein HMPREF0391_10404 [Finegoldia magna ATCC 53516]
MTYKIATLNGRFFNRDFLKIKKYYKKVTMIYKKLLNTFVV